MNEMRPFRVRVPQSDLDDLHFRLDHTRWPDELPAAGWEYGIPLAQVRALADRWRRLDWRAVEDRLNTHPQYVTEIDGQNIHFQHVRSADPDALPLLLTHGWPGSTVEFQHLIPLLTDRFQLVVPAIPGFGFSGPTTAKGWGQGRVARAWATLMDRLGYQRYGAHGGDWGSGISRLLAAAAPGNVVGVHVNYLPTPGSPTSAFTAEDHRRLDQTMALARNRHPHQLMFASRPQTLAYASTDSPVGQLAFIAEKFTEWADPATPVADDVILTDVMHYWITRTAASSSRLIKESANSRPTACPVPLGVAVLPHDLTRSIRLLAAQHYDLKQWTEFPRGGHFAALEVPDLLAADLTTFFTS
jgi:epoxide hydrolase